MSQTATTATYFDAHQHATVEAAMARVIPTDQTPGAREAGTIDFLERYLSGIDYIYAKPDGSGFERLAGKQAGAWMQRVEAARAKYVTGVQELDRLAAEVSGTSFVDLDEAQQDDVLRSLERVAQGEDDTGGTAEIAYSLPAEPALQQTSAEDELNFFPLLVTHTRQGFLSDPIYGGNRNQVGWQAIGFPGPASMLEVHTGRYSTLEYFAENRNHPGQKDDRDA